KEPVKRDSVTHVATSSNQVWSWNITWLSEPVCGQNHKLHLILVMFSRFILGYEVWDTENNLYSKQLVRKVLLSQGIAGKHLILNSDIWKPISSPLSTSVVFLEE